MDKFLMQQPSNMDENALTRIPSLLRPVANQFDKAVNKYGPTHQSVAWRDKERQQRRFQIFLGLLAYDTGRNNVSINDLGCGYGAMFETFKELIQFADGTYYGYDISESMIRVAKENIRDPRAIFINNHVATEKADYSFASGTYNMKMDANENDWLEYIEKNLVNLWKKTRIGMGFNMLNIQSPLREKNLYYADPSYFLKFCDQYLDKKVRMIDLLHPNEFVIIVRR